LTDGSHGIETKAAAANIGIATWPRSSKTVHISQGGESKENYVRSSQPQIFICFLPQTGLILRSERLARRVKKQHFIPHLMKYLILCASVLFIRCSDNLSGPPLSAPNNRQLNSAMQPSEFSMVSARRDCHHFTLFIRLSLSEAVSPYVLSDHKDQALCGHYAVS
jgi:hypothetical protein